MLTACPYTFKSLMEKRALLNEIPTDEQIVLVNNLLFIIELIFFCNKFDSSFINSIFLLVEWTSIFATHSGQHSPVYP